jgi:D-alanyl-D-alanine dipeptidase
VIYAAANKYEKVPGFLKKAQKRVADGLENIQTSRIHIHSIKQRCRYVQMEKINPADLVDMHSLHEEGLVRIELAYARGDNLLFGERIYRENARLWAHKALSVIIEGAARSLRKQGLRLVLYDGLRTTDAQALMLKTQVVRSNPHWLEEPRLLSPPGAGAHPRGMAIDCSLETLDGKLLDMGTPFDDLSPQAHRDAQNISDATRKNREILTQAMMAAALEAGVKLLPLPQEWWDFRLPTAAYERYAPLGDADLPPDMRMV